MLGFHPISADAISAAPVGGTAPPVATKISGTKVTGPQEIRAREVAGYAVTFIALGALLASASPPVGAANYTVGTHGAALASMQPQPQVWGSTPSPVVVEVQPLRTIVAAPHQLDSAYGSVWGIQPEGIDSKPPYTLVAAPEQVGISYGKVWQLPLPPAQVDSPVLRTFTVHLQLLDPAYALLWGPEPPPVASEVQPKTLLALSQQIDSAYGLVWGSQPDGIDTQPPRTVVTAPEQSDSAYGKVWRLPLPPAQVDTPVLRTLVAGLSPPDPAYGLVWGVQPEGIDTRVGYTFVAPPQQVSQVHFTYWGITPVLGADTPVFGTLYASYQEFDPAYAVVWGLPPVSVDAVPDIIFRSTLVSFQQVIEPPTHFTYWGTTPVPPTADVIFRSTLFAAQDQVSFSLRFDGFRGRTSLYIPPAVGVTPAIVRPGGRVVIHPNAPGEPVIARFDFLSSIGVSNAIVSAEVTAAVYTGVDSNPAAVLSGVAVIEGTAVLQLVNEGVVGVVYRLLCRATVSSGHTPEMSGYYTVPQPKGI